MKIEAQEARAAQKQAIPLPKVGLMKLPEGQLRGVEADDSESFPAQAADPAIGISLALETPSANRQDRKLGDRTRRHQGHGYALAAGVEASDVRDTGQENVSFRRQRVLTNDHLVALEIRQCA